MLHDFLTNLFNNYYETTAVIVYGIGFSTLLLNNNLIKKIIGFNFMDTSMYMFLASKGYINGRLAPIALTDSPRAENYINPIPAGLVLTGIVVSVSFTAFFLALTVKLYQAYHSLNLDVIVRRMHDEQERKLYSRKQDNAGKTAKIQEPAEIKKTSEMKNPAEMNDPAEMKKMAEVEIPAENNKPDNTAEQGGM